MAGAMTSLGVLFSVQGAFARGFEVVLLADWCVKLKSVDGWFDKGRSTSPSFLFRCCGGGGGGGGGGCSCSDRSVFLHEQCVANYSGVLCAVSDTDALVGLRALKQKPYRPTIPTCSCSSCQQREFTRSVIDSLEVMAPSPASRQQRNW